MFCPRQSSFAVRHLQFLWFLTLLAIGVMPDGTVVFGMYIGTDQHKFRHLWPLICYMKDIPVGLSYKIILPPYSLYLFQIISISWTLMVKISEDIPQGICTGIFTLSFCFPEIFSLMYPRAIFTFSEAALYWWVIMIRWLLMFFFSFQLKSYKNIASIHNNPEAAIHGNLVFFQEQCSEKGTTKTQYNLSILDNYFSIG